MVEESEITHSFTEGCHFVHSSFSKIPRMNNQTNPSKEIRIHFVDFWPAFDKENNFIVSALAPYYKVIMDSVNPEYLFCSASGIDHFKYKNPAKIYFTGENDVPDFNLYDYAMGSSHLDFGGRYFRFPLYVLSEGFDKLFSESFDTEAVVKRKFCNFVYSNAQFSDPYRQAFFHRLSQYKKVDSGGKYLNNIGKPVADKLAFIGEYKFTIAFENSSVSGYTTEKLVDPMRVNSLPVYWGNPDVGKDFNTKSFINGMDYSSMDELVEEIVRLDNDDVAYLDKLSQPWIESGKIPDFKADLAAFLVEIIELPLPLSKQTTDYGYNHLYKKRQQIGSSIYNNKILRPLLKRLIR
jgi:hypothetical protein